VQKLERLQKSKKAKKNPQIVNDYIASTQQKSGPAMMFATIDYPGCATLHPATAAPPDPAPPAPPPLPTSQLLREEGVRGDRRALDVDVAHDRHGLAGLRR